VFCPQCGNPNPAEAPCCTQCGAPLKTYPSAGSSGQPATVLTPAAPPGSAPPPPSTYQLAGLGDRLLAVILDAVLIAAVFALAGMWAAGRWGGATPSGFSLQGTAALVTFAATLLFGFLYYWLCEGLVGRTLGKGILGLSVRMKDGGPCTLSSSLVRNLLRVIDGIAVYLVGFLVAIFSASRQRLGDHVAKTVVVAAPVNAVARGAFVVGWLVLWVGGLIGAYLLHRVQPQSLATETAHTSLTPAARTGDLQFVNAAFLQAEDGPPRPAAPYKPGDVVYLKYEVVGFNTNQEGKTDLILQVEVRDPNGLSVYPMWEKELIQTIPAGKPVSGSFSVGIPSFAPPGVYKVGLKALDKVKNTTADLSPTFQAEAPSVSPASRLELRDFALSLSKDGPPAETPVLEGGGTIYMSWKIFGVDARDGKVNLRVALKVLGPGEKPVVDEPGYVVVDDAFHYRPPTFCLPMSGHVTLPGSFAKGTYTAHYTVTDEIAKSEIQHAAKFELR
jgi:uncharacterized RDD family membrane protein YckC